MGTPDGDEGIPFETHPRVRDGRAYTDLTPPAQALRNPVPERAQPRAERLCAPRRCQIGREPRYSRAMKSPIRPAIENLEPNGIGLVAMMALGEPGLIPLWFGESDLVTPDFIREAAKKALDDGKTFYSASRGILPLREAIRDFHKRTVGADVGLERISMPGAATLAVVTALQILAEPGRQCCRGLAHLAEHLSGSADGRRGSSFRTAGR